MSPDSQPLAVLIVEVEAALAARLEALLSTHHQRVAVRTVSVADASRSGTADAAVVAAAVGATPVDDHPGLVRLLRSHRKVPIVVVAEADDDEAALAALRRHVLPAPLSSNDCGVVGEDLIAALTRAAGGRTVLDITIGGRIASRLAQQPWHDHPRLDDWDLRPREREVLEALLDGRTNREIAQQLHLELLCSALLEF